MNPWEEFDVVPDSMPEDIESEKALLSTLAFMGDKGIEVALSLLETDFVHPNHQKVFVAIRSLHGKQTEINALTIKSELESLGQLQKVGGYPYIVELLQELEVDHPEVLVGILKEKTRLRQLISIGSKTAERAKTLGDSAEIIAEASEAITRLAMGNPGKQIISDMSDLMDDLLAGAAITTRNGGKAMSWGDPILDSICPIPRGEPTLVVARPGVGKSALALQILCGTVNSGIGRPLFLSLEMGREKVKARLAGHLSGSNSRIFRDAQYSEADVNNVYDRKHILSGIKVMFPNQQCPIEEIETLVRHAVDIHGIDCVVLDQFSHIHAPREAKKEQFAISNSMLSQRLTALAKNLNLGWVTLGQINRDGEDARRPNMKDLADTDRLAKDAAVIFGLWNKGTDEKQEVWGTIIKNRDDGHKGWAKQLEVDYGTCNFRVTENYTEPPKIRF